MRINHQEVLCLLILLICGTLQVPTPVNMTAKTLNLSSQPENELKASKNLPFYPLGIYGVLNTTEVWNSWNNWFNTVPIGFSEEDDFKLPIEDMLLTCDVLGLRVLFDTSYFLRTRSLSDLMDIILSVVDHPSIYAWYIVDEPGIRAPDINWTHINEDLIREAVELIQRIDSRPTFVQFSLGPINDSTWKASYNEVPDFVDIISVDPYPNMPYINHSFVSNWVDTIHRYNAGRAQVWTVLTAQDSSQSDGEKGFDIPMEPEYMIDAMLALQRGVEGLLWFAYGEITDDSFGASRVPASWDALGRVVRRISQVVPIIVDRENEMQPVILEENLEIAYAKRGTQTVVFLANHNYYWNGSETVWHQKSIPLTLKAPGVYAVSQIEPHGPVPLEYRENGEFISFNISINGGMILLIESTDSISVSEFSGCLILVAMNLALIVTLRDILLRKKRFFNYL